jgi:hypothetical protein
LFIFLLIKIFWVKIIGFIIIIRFLSIVDIALKLYEQKKSSNVFIVIRSIKSENIGMNIILIIYNQTFNLLYSLEGISLKVVLIRVLIYLIDPPLRLIKFMNYDLRKRIWNLETVLINYFKENENNGVLIRYKNKWYSKKH